tara:strand:+ start:1299 stop:1997 length:699 start_codon:yes stop_codon:yes gene_type:complete
MLFWIGLFLLVGIVTFYYSRLQPFPEIGGKFSGLVLLLALFLWISESSPREGSEDVAPTLSLITGGLGVIFGIRHMGITKKDVILAPLGGVLFCAGGIWLLSSRWDDAEQFQQIGLFVVASILLALEIYLIFRGLVIGIPGVSWSKSGIRQIQRGLIEGPNGAIAHFEKSWDSEDSWINSMSHAALILIYRKLGNKESEKHHTIELERNGGWSSLDDSWVKAVEDSLGELNF